MSRPFLRIDYYGEMLTFVELAERVGICVLTIQWRYYTKGLRGERLWQRPGVRRRATNTKPRQELNIRRTIDA